MVYARLLRCSSPGCSPDFYDQSLVDGYNLPLAVHISDGYNVRHSQIVGHRLDECYSLK